MKALELFSKGVCLFGMLYIFSSCNVLNKRMSSSEYYSYLREDTVICELNTFTVESSFEPVLNAVINTWEDCPVCKKDPHPFVFEIEEILHEDILTYTIKTNTSPKIAHNYYFGAFTHEGYVFVVVEKPASKSSFVYNEENEPTRIYFCDRIHSTKCGLLIKCEKADESYDITSVECKTEERIKINFYQK